MKDLKYTNKSFLPPCIFQFWGTLRVKNSSSPQFWGVRGAKYGYAFVKFGLPLVRNVLLLPRKIKALLRNDYPFVEFGVPFIINVFALSRKIKALLRNDNPFVDFGFFNSTNENPFVEFRFPLVANDYPFVELGFPLEASQTLAIRNRGYKNIVRLRGLQKSEIL